MDDKMDIAEVLLHAMEKYGKLVMAGSDRAPLIKKGSATESVKCGDISFQKLKEASLKAGDLLEADPDKGIIIATVPVGAMKSSRALLVGRLEKDGVEVAAFFKEGLIKQHGAIQAVDSIKHYL